MFNNLLIAQKFSRNHWKNAIKPKGTESSLLKVCLKKVWILDAKENITG